MELIDLKKNIQEKKIDENFYIFVYKDVPFVCDQYITAISSILNLEIRYIDNINQHPDFIKTSLFDTKEYLYVLKVEEFNTKLEKIPNNLIIICKKVINNDLKDHIVEFPVLQQWHLAEYIKNSCLGLEDKQINWLVSNYNDIYKINNEISKINIFHKHIQKSIMIELFRSNNYDTNNNIYNLTNCIIKKDINSLTTLLNKDKLDYEPMFLVRVLENNLKNIIQVQNNPNISYKELNINYRQLIAIKYNCNSYTMKQLLKMYEFITSIDYKLKSGLLDMSNYTLNEYIITKLLTF